MGHWAKQARAALSLKNFTQAGDFFKLDGNYRAAAKAYLSGKNFSEAAKLFENMGQVKKAEKLLLKNGSPKDIADFHIRNNNHEKATAVYLNSNMHYEAAELLEKLNQWPRAAALYEDLKFYDKAGILFGKSKNFDKAIEMFSLVIKNIDEVSVPLAKVKILKYKNWIANLHIGAKRFTKAGEIYEASEQKEKAAKCFARAGDFVRAAEILFDIGKLDEALATLANVRSVASKVLQGRVALRRGEYANAAKLLIDTDSPALLAEAYENLDQFREAAYQLEILGDLERAADMYAKAKEYQKAALLYEQNGLYDRAARNYELQRKFESAAKFYKMAQNHFKAGMCLHQINQDQEALKLLQQVSEDHEHIFQAKTVMAEIFFGQGVYSVARRLLEEFTSKVTLQDATMSSFYYLARCMEEEDNLEGAKKYFERIAARKFNYLDVTDRLKALQHVKSGAAKKNRKPPSSDVSPFDLTEGHIIDGRFKVEGTIGKGGMGSIFKVIDLDLSRVIALKMLTHKKSDFEELKSELLIARELTHPFIIKVFDVGMWMKIGYFTMEYVDGRPLKNYIHSSQDVTLDEKIQLLIKICQGLKAAHDQAVVHRDIKPQNIIIDSQGNPKILDFGIARKVTKDPHNKTISGSPKYMAPEQIQNADTDLRTDIYAIGIIMFYMFTLKEPFLAKTPQEVMRMHLDTPLPDPMTVRPDIPYWLCDIIRKCCQKKPVLRFHEMGELIDELKLNLMDFH